MDSRGLSGSTTSSSNSTCTEDYKVPQAIIAIQILSYFVIFGLGVTLNGFVIFLVVKRKGLRQRTFYLALQIIAGNLVNSVILFPARITTAVVGDWVFGTPLCQLAAYLFSTLMASRAFLMFIFILDRYLAVQMPFLYPIYGRKFTTALSVTTWVFTVLTCSIPLSLQCFDYDRATHSCDFTIECRSGNGCRQFLSTFSPALFTIGGILPLALYLLLYVKAKKLARQVHPALGHTVNGTTPRIPHNPRGRNNRAEITFLLLFLGLIGLFLPYGFMNALRFFAMPELRSNPPTGFTAVYLLLGHSLFLSIVVLDPVVVLRNRDVRDEVAMLYQIFRRRLSTSEVSVQSITESFN